MLALYDAGRMPFKNQVPRGSFVNFIADRVDELPQYDRNLLESLSNCDQRDLLETHLRCCSVCSRLGKIAIVINAGGAGLDFEWIARQSVTGGSESTFTMFTH